MLYRGGGGVVLFRGSYAFETKEQEHTAKHEVEIIGYIRKNTRMDDPDIVLALYNKLVLKRNFCHAGRI